MGKNAAIQVLSCLLLILLMKMLLEGSGLHNSLGFFSP
jgi:hypothetical protein